MWPIQPLAGRFTVAARIGEILPSVANHALPRRVTRKHGRAYTRTRCTKVACRLLYCSLSLSLSFSPPLSLCLSRVRRTMDGIAHQPTRSWFSCSSGVTCPRRISTVTFYRFLRSPPSAFTVKTADFQRRALSHGAHIVYPAKRASALAESRRNFVRLCESPAVFALHAYAPHEAFTLHANDR